MIVTSEDFWIFMVVIAAAFAMGAAISAIASKARYLKQMDMLYDLAQEAKRGEKEARERLFKYITGETK